MIAVPKPDWFTQPVEAAECACIFSFGIDVPEFGGNAVWHDGSQTGMIQECAGEAYGIPTINTPVVDQWCVRQLALFWFLTVEQTLEITNKGFELLVSTQK